RSIRDMTVRPRSVLAGGRTARIEQAELSDENERASSVCRLPLRDPFVRATEVDRACPRTFGCTPGDRSVEGPIDFERAGAVAVCGEQSPKSAGEAVSRDGKHLSRRDIAENERRVGQHGDRR